MNHTYRLVWNEAGQCQIPAPENARSRGKRSGVKPLVVALLAVCSLNAHALPTDGAVSAGSASIAQAGAAMTVHQASQNLAVNWQSFNIGANERVTFVQPNASAIALNRVLGSDPSQILGQLNANGQVWVLNPNGLLFGTSAQVNVGGLVASTLNISDADFLAGRRTFSGSGGAVTNQGAINADYVALLGGQVSNEGVITAQLGTVALAAGNQITLDFNGDQLLNVQVEQGALDALAQNKQLIRADGGTVLMTAQAADALATAVVNNTGVIEARSIENHNGVIKLLGDMDHGMVNVGGTLDASATLPPLQGEGGGGDGLNGGFIETSAAHVRIADDAVVTTLAANGQSGTWLIDPIDFTIASGSGALTTSGIGASTLATSLGGGNVAIATYATTAGNGDIFVNSAVSWSANTKLTLTAHRNIAINASLNGSGTASSLALEYGQGAVAAGNTSTYTLSGGAQVNLPAGNNFSTKLGSNGATTTYTVITSLGVAGDATVAPGTMTLQGMRTGLAGKYALGANIDASATSGWNAGAGFAPVGTLANNFTGIFDGLGHTISSLAINRPATDYIGLFGYAGATSKLRHVGLLNSSISGQQSVGTLAGRSGGAISDCHADGGSATGRQHEVGGLVGYSSSSIDNSYANVAVSATNGGVGSTATGGLVGWQPGGTISNSYATGAVSGNQDAGGLVGQQTGGTISNSYATGAVSGNQVVGGLVGLGGSTISNSYATGAVSGNTDIGGLVGNVWAGSVSNSYATGSVAGATNVGGLAGSNTGTVSNSYWDTQTSGQATSQGGTGKTTAEMKSLATFAAWGANIDNAGGSGAVWRIYDGYTYPLLRGFLTALNVQPAYDGSGAALGNVAAYTVSGAYDAAKVLGSAGSTLTLAGTAANAHTATLGAGLYSTQTGYDISLVGRSISTPGSASGDVVLNNAVTWSSGKLTLNAQNNIAIKSSLNGSGTASLALEYGQGAVAAGNASTYTLGNGAQVNLPAGNNFSTKLGSDGATTTWTVITALGAAGDATVAPGVMTLQGMNTGLAGNYVLGADINNAGDTNTWNGGLGFTPVGTNIANFTGVFDGLGHTITGLSINRPTTNYVGLFGYAGSGSGPKNVGLVGGSVSGADYVGGLAGYNDSGTISNSHSTGSVTGSGGYAGGLVGYNRSGAIDNSYSTGSVSGTLFVGGLVGFNWSGAIDNSYSTGAVDGSGIVGGLAGYNDSGTISNSYSTGAVGGSGDLGGLVGNNSSGTISNSYSTGSVTGSSGYIGGLVGDNGSGTISNSYSTGAVDGNNYTGGLVGSNDSGTISNSFSTGSVSGDFYVGGLVGYNNSGTISNSYSTGAVGGSNYVGGLVGKNFGTVTASFWDTQTSGRATSSGGTGKTTAQMQSLATFAAWDIDDAGGTGKVWRIYDGYTNPLLRGFLTALNVQPDYGGSGAALTNVGAVTPVGAHDAGKVFTGSLYADTLTLASTAISSYTATSTAKNIYSTQTGYDLVSVARTIATPGSASGDIALTTPINWSSGTLAINTTGTITDTAAISGSGTAVFDLQAGAWNQVNATLPAFAAYDFRISGGRFVRALGGDGTVGTPYQLADIYGMQGMGSSGMLGLNYTLANNVDASGTANWNGGLGFTPVGTNVGSQFTGVFDGLGHTITGLTVNNVWGDYQGLFGYSSGTLRNIGLLNSSISGRSGVGTLAGLSNGAISTSYADGGSVTGNNGGSAAGGLMGGGSGTIDYSYANVSVTGVNTAGGLKGSGSGNVSNSYATGNVSGVRNAGGLVGQQAFGTISNSYSTGTVTGTFFSGGLTGGRDSLSAVNANVSNSYWNTQTSGWATSLGGTGKSTAEMKSFATFAAWNIANSGGSTAVWRIYEGTSYPLLASFLTPLTVTGSAASKAYDGLAYSGGNGVTYSTAPNANLLGTASYGGTSQGAINVGSYVITPSGLYSNQQGYDITYANGALTVDKANLTVTANSASKTYDGLAYSGGNGVSYSGFVNGETSAVLGGALSYGGNSQGAANPGSYFITPGGLTSGNYTIVFNDGTLTFGYGIPSVPGAPTDGYVGAITSVATGASASPGGSAVAIAGGSTSASSGAAFLTVDNGESAAGSNVQLASAGDTQGATGGNAQGESGDTATSDEEAAADSFATEYALVTRGCGQRLPPGLSCQ